MSYLVFARKYRPRKFSEVTGQDHVTLALTNAVTRDKVPHALLFSGPRGVGKTSCARILSKILNCTSLTFHNEEPTPCEECSSCKEIAKGNNLAVIEIDGASNNSVEDVRELIETLYIAPPPGIKYKIYIIDEVHMLSTAAFNALLKSIEEPPSNTLFILATTETHKIPDTIKSRCQEHIFRKLRSDHIVSQLSYICEQEKINISQEILRLVSRVADGGMRDASSLLDRISSLSSEELKSSDLALLFGTLDSSYFLNLIESIINIDEEKALSQIENAFSQGIEVKIFLSDILLYFRLLFLYSLASRRGAKAASRFFELKDLSDTEQEGIRRISENKPTDIFSILFEMIRSICDQAIKSDYPQYVIESGVVKMCYASRLMKINPIRQDDIISDNKNNEIELKKKVLTETSNSSQELSWTSFLNFIKKNNEVLLSTYLSRVVPDLFTIKEGMGIINLKGVDFVIESIKDKVTISNLKKQLSLFSDIDNWNINFVIQKEVSKGEPSDHIRGSHAYKSQEKRLEKISRIESEAKESEAVKIVLDIFKGSTIEKVIADLGSRNE